MKKAVCILLLIAVTGTGHLHSSGITLHFSQYPGTPVLVLLKQGISTDTLYNGVLDKDGAASFAVPAAYAGYTGMATVRVEDTNLDFIVSSKGENLTVSCGERYIHGGNTVFEGSPENEYLQRQFIAQMNRLQKINYLTGLVRLYSPGNEFGTAVQQEKDKLEREQTAFTVEIDRNPLYAARFIQLYNFLHGEIATLDYADSTRMAAVRGYVRDSLDINSLYTSGLWFETINGLLALYDTGMPFHSEYINDMSVLLSKATPGRVYNTLADNLISICESMSWGQLEEQLAYTLINQGRIGEPEGKVKMLMTMFKLAKGSEAPALTSGKRPANALLVFYESGCGNCEDEMMSLRRHYPAIRQKGYEVVSISADVDESIYKNTSGSFPWKSRICELKGFSGEDFGNYGIIGTPTFFVIDKDGKVQGRYARLQDTGVVN